MKGLKLYILYTGCITLPKGHMTPGTEDAGEIITFPAYCYLIDHPNGKVLLDCGMNHGGPAAVRDEDIVVNRLAEIGITPDDIKYVVLSHMHIDHAAYMTSFPNATFVVRKEELKTAWWPEECEKGYCYPDYKDTRDYDYIQLLDEENFDLFMDGSVVLIDTKGHTRGHQSVLLDLEETGKVCLVADASSFRENMDKMVLPGFCSSPWDALQSLRKLKHLEREGYLLIFGHDIAQKESLKLSPDYYG